MPPSKVTVNTATPKFKAPQTSRYTDVTYRSFSSQLTISEQEFHSPRKRQSWPISSTLNQNIQSLALPPTNCPVLHSRGRRKHKGGAVLSHHPSLYVRTVLLRCALEHQLAHAGGISLTAHGLHHGTNHSASSLHLAVANLLKHVWLLRERRINRLDQWAIV